MFPSFTYTVIGFICMCDSIQSKTTSYLLLRSAVTAMALSVYVVAQQADHAKVGLSFDFIAMILG